MSPNDYTEEHEVLQTCVDIILEHRSKHGLSSGSIPQVAFYTYFLWLLPKIGVISENSAFMLRSVYTLHVKNTAGIDILPIMAHLFKWFSAAKEDSSHLGTTEVSFALFSVSNLICEQEQNRNGVVADFEVSLNALHDVLSIFDEA